MSRDARIELDWAGGVYSFRLGFGQLIELEEVSGAGVAMVHARLMGDDWRVKDISNVIRLGLIGGGVGPAEALVLVRRHVEGPPPLDNLVFAQAILGAGIMGAPDEPLGQGGGKDDAEPLPDGRMRAADVFGAGAVMGFTPQEVCAMSMWQFLAAVEGYAKAHDPKAGQRNSEAERDELWDMISRW